MPVPGDTQERFGRSYIFINPDPTIQFLRGRERSSTAGTVGTWRLSLDDEYVPGGGGDDPTGGSGTVATAQLAVDSGGCVIGNLLYIDSSGLARKAKGDDMATSNVAGVAMEAKAAGDVVKYGTNIVIDIFDTALVTDNDIGGLFAVGNSYYLSSVNEGNWTVAPDTTTVGSVVVQCGIAINTNQMLVEIQDRTEV